MSRSLTLATSVALVLLVSTTTGLMMPHPNQPRRVRKLAQIRAMRLQADETLPPFGEDPPPLDGPPDAVGGETTTAGESDSTECTTTTGTTCQYDGSTNYVSRSLTWDASTGKFTGTMVTNLCSNNAYGFINYTQTQDGGQHTSDCKSQTFPSPSYTTAPSAAPTLGTVGYSLYGVNIYGPFEAGFTTGQACTNSLGDCAGGVDIGVCEAELMYECGVANVAYSMLMDTCGGHALPYHYHTEMFCDESGNGVSTTENTGAHAVLVGVALDGHGIYGTTEAGTSLPTDLDACGGHYGPVPGSNLTGIEHDGATNVYHYHSQTSPPYLLGCYGPVSSITECRSLYSSTCGSTITVTNADGTTKDYDDYCPCYDSTGSNVVDTTTTTTTPQGSSTQIEMSSAAARPSHPIGALSSGMFSSSTSDRSNTPSTTSTLGAGVNACWTTPSCGTATLQCPDGSALATTTPPCASGGPICSDNSTPVCPIQGSLTFSVDSMSSATSTSSNVFGSADGASPLSIVLCTSVAFLLLSVL